MRKSIPTSEKIKDKGNNLRLMQYAFKEASKLLGNAEMEFWQQVAREIPDAQKRKVAYDHSTQELFENAD